MPHDGGNCSVRYRDQHMKKTRISRRTMLKGVGTATIGLPLLEEMLASPAMAAERDAVPVRAFNVFFGLGIPAPLQAVRQPSGAHSP